MVQRTEYIVSSSTISSARLRMLFMWPIRTISNVKRKINPGLEIAGILITMVDKRTNYSREIIDLLHSTYGSKLRIFDSVIPLSIRAAETSAEGRSIYLHDPAGKVSTAYAALTREVLA